MRQHQRAGGGVGAGYLTLRLRHAAAGHEDSNPAAKHYTILRLAMAVRSVGMIITANPSTLLELARLADAQRESLVRDIFDGTLSATWMCLRPSARHCGRGPPVAPRPGRELERIIRAPERCTPRTSGRACRSWRSGWAAPRASICRC